MSGCPLGAQPTFGIICGLRVCLRAFHARWLKALYRGFVAACRIVIMVMEPSSEQNTHCQALHAPHSCPIASGILIHARRAFPINSTDLFSMLMSRVRACVSPYDALCARWCEPWPPLTHHTPSHAPLPCRIVPSTLLQHDHCSSTHPANFAFPFTKPSGTLITFGSRWNEE